MSSTQVPDLHPMSVGAATTADRGAVVDLWGRVALTTSYNDPGEDFDFALGQANSDVLIGRVGGVIVASVLVGHDGHRGWLYYVAVDPDHQKRGCGGGIVAAGEAWLAECGVRKVMLLVRETNTRVIRFYQDLAYEAVPRTVMQKWLVPPG